MAARSLLLVALVAAVAATGAVAAEPPAAGDEQRLICRGGERQLGSRIRTPRRCRTAEQWQAEDEARARVPQSLQVTAGQNDGRQTARPQ